jgi:subtilisin
MPKALWLLAAACGVAMALPAGAGAVTTTPIDGQYIVVLKDGASGKATAAEHARSTGAQVLKTYDSAVHAYTAKLSTTGLVRVKADPRVAYVIQDREGKPTLAQTLPTGINRVDADLSTALAGDGTGQVAGDVAVYDSGIDTTHPDLNVAGGVNCVVGGPSSDGTYGDQFGHGTHVAGIIGAKDDGNGVVGVAPGVRLWSVRDLGVGGGGSISAQLCGIDWITANGPSLGIKVANSSQGMLTGALDDGNCGTTNGDVLHQAICRSVAAGIVWVFAAGNNTKDFAANAGANYDEVLTVTAMADSNGQPNVGSTQGVSCTETDLWGGTKGHKSLSTPGQGKPAPAPTNTDDKYASWSAWAVGSADQAHTVAAPGVCIYSTLHAAKGYYGNLSGTSMAAPHVAGTVHLCVLSGQCTGTPAEIVQKVRSDAATFNASSTGFGFTGDPLRPVTGRYYGYLVRAGLY